MGVIHKKLVTDENNRPVAVQFDYEDWLKIERELNLKSPDRVASDINRHAGCLKLTEDPLDYQKRCRDEWN